MSLQVEKLENNMAKLTIEVPAEDFDKAIEKVYQKQKNKIAIPGFRKGKAPRKMVEQMYGASIFYEDAANLIIPDAYDKALEECEEDIVSSPKIEVTQIGGKEPFIFTAEVALKPDVTLGRYKGIEVAKADIDVTEDEINEEIDRNRDQNSRTVAVDDRAVEDGDMTVIDFEGFVDGKAFEGGKGEDYPLTIGSGAFIPGFEEALIGAQIGKETEVNVTFPEDYHAEELKGKAALFKCTVKEIKEKQLPTVEETVEDLGFDTIDEYKADIKERLTDRKVQDAKSAKEDAVIDAIIEDSKMEIPDAMLETQQRQMLDDFVQRIQSQGLSMEQYMQLTGTTQSALIEQVRPQALKRIQARLVLEEVAKAEGIVPTEEDFEEEVKTMGEVYGLDTDKVKEMLGVSGKKQVMEDICVKKAVEFVTSNAKEV